MIIKFYDGQSLTISESDGVKVKAAINAGAEWITVLGNDYKVSAISKLQDGKTNQIKTFRELGLPELAIPDEMKDAYDRRTIQFNERKKIGGGNG